MDPAINQLQTVRAAALNHLQAVKESSAAEQSRARGAIAAAEIRLEEATLVLSAAAHRLLAESRPVTVSGVAEVLAFAISREGADALPELTDDGRDFHRALVLVCVETLACRPQTEPSR